MKDKKKNQKKPAMEIKLLKDRIKELEKLTLEHKKMEEELRESKQRFQTIFDGAIDGLLLADLDTRKFNIGNRRICEMLGYELDEINKLGFDDIHPKDALPHVLEQVRKQVAGEIAVAEDLPVLRKDGSIFYADIASSPLQIGGKPFLLGIFRDITERKNAEGQLRKSEDRYRGLTENINLGIYRNTVGPEGKFIEANPGIIGMFGYKNKEEFLAIKVSDLYKNPKDRDKLNDKILKEGFVRGEELWLKKKDESLFVGSVSAVAVKDKQGQVKYYDGIIDNITERKKAEEEREKTLRRQQSVSQLQQSLLAPAPLENKLRNITDGIVRIFDVDFCRIWLIRPGDLCERDCIHAQVVEGPHICRYRDRCLHLLASSGRYTHTDGKTHRRVPFGCYKIGRVASDEDNKFITNDVQNDPRVHNHEWARELGLVSFAGYQLGVPGEKTMGVLALFAKQPILSSEDSMLGGLSSTVAQVIRQGVAEETLKESEQKFRTIFDKTSDGMFLVDLETRKFLMCNATCLQMLGYAQEEFPNMEISDIHPPDDLPFIFEQIAKYMKGEEGVRHDVRFRRKDGSFIFSDLSPALVTLAGRKFILISFKDITERKKAEEEKELNERRLLDLLELYKIAGFKEKAIFDFTLEASLRSLQSEFSFLAFLSADEAEMTIHVWTRGVMEQCAVSETPLHFPVAQSGLLGEMVRQRRPIIVNNYDTSTEFKKGYPTGHVPIKRFLGIPVFSGDKITCLAAVANKVSEYTTSDVNAFTALLNQMWHIAERIQIQEEKRQVTEKLTILVKKLEDRNYQNIIMGEMREMLQACSTMEEAAPTIRGLMEKLFPNSEGALFMMSPSRSDLESVARWGDFPTDVDDNVFAPDACWALRRGRTYIVENVSVGPLCPHLKHPPSTAYVCLPLIAKSDVLGLLHLRSRQSTQIQSEQNAISDLKDIAVILSEYLSLSIANIQLNERLASQSVRDPLTGLFNRRFMIESLEREIKRAERNRTQVGIIMADIDHFKQLNDKYGHAAGDKVLTQMGGFFKAGLRGSDVACRYGGEEFVFILPESSAENTFKRADQMREDVKKLEVHYDGELPASITLSMGISTYPDQGSNAEDLLRVADAALYRAKQEGRDRVIIG